MDSQVSSWTVEQVAEWMLANDLGLCLDYVIDRKIDGKQLLQLKTEELKLSAPTKEKLGLALQKLRRQDQKLPTLLPSPQSILRPYRRSTTLFESHCGYCKRGMNTSYGFISHRLTAADYESLTDRGWTRCGYLLYKPILPLNCCPHYSIRLKIHEFEPSKSQKKTIKRMENFLLFGSVTKPKNQTNVSKCASDKKCGEVRDQHKEDREKLIRATELTITVEIETAIKKAQQKAELPQFPPSLNIIVHHCFETRQNPTAVNRNSLTSTEMCSSSTTESHFVVWYSSPIAISWASFLIEEEKPNLSKSNNNASNCSQFEDKFSQNKKETKEKRKREIQQKSMEIASIIIKYFDRTKVKEIRIEPPGFLRFSVIHTFFKESSSTTVSEGIPLTTEKLQSSTPSKAHNLETILIPSTFIDEEYELYRKYQMSVHKESPEKVTPQSYSSFLVETPLLYEKNDRGFEYGTFHMQYRLDGKLIAVSVVDIMPHSVESVYFFWDPDYAHLRLGIWSAQKEIEFAKTLPGVDYYNLGYYVHTCRKMNYKGKFKPSDILCPDTYVYVPFGKEIREKLDEFGYTRLAPPDVKEPPPPTLDDLNEVLVLYQGSVKPFKSVSQFIVNLPETQQLLLEYVNAAGLELSKRIVLSLNGDYF
jgi:arginine-tRNA-protein transferase